jgi:hypothetical protein
MISLPTVASESDDPFTVAAESIVGWLTKVSGSLGGFVTTQNNSQLRDRLHALNGALYELESDKATFLFEVSQSNGSPSEIARLESIATKLPAKIDAVKDTVHGLAVLLREEFKEDEKECERKLNDAIMARKTWVKEILNNPDELRDPASRDVIMKKGNEAVGALRVAGIEVSKLMDQLPN